MPGGLVPLITNYGAAESLYAPASGGGGGGGGGGANLSVSSIAVIAGGQINMNASASAIGTLNMEYNSTINQGSQIAFQVDQGIGGFIGMGYDNTTSTIAVTYISETGGASGGLGMSFDIGNISSLIVSSINGASPAGGGVAPAGISTNAVNAATTTKLTLNGANGIAIDTAGTGTVTINSAQINAPASDLLISSINGAAPGGAAISTFDTASVSSLTVSSINGAAPGGGIANTSTGSLAQSFILTAAGAPVTAVTSPFNTTVGNLYNLSWQDTVFVDGTPGGANANLQYSISSSAGFLPLEIQYGAPLSSVAISSLLSHNLLFKAEGATGQLVLSQTVMPSTFVNLVAGQDIVVRDLGAVV